MSRIGYIIIVISFLWPMLIVATAALWGDWSKFVISSILVLISTICSISIILFLSNRKGGNSTKIKNINGIDKDVMSFVISFLPAFFINEISDTKGLVIFISFSLLFIMALIATRSYFTNLFLLFWGWRVYSAEIQSGGREVIHAYLIVPRENKLTNDIVKLVRIASTNFYVVPRLG